MLLHNNCSKTFFAPLGGLFLVVLRVNDVTPFPAICKNLQLYATVTLNEIKFGDISVL